MTRINADTLPWTAQSSPQGKYGVRRRALSQAAGSPKDTGTWGGGHPFEVEIHRIAPGKTNFPFHAHAAQWEGYYVLSGQGTVRGPEKEEPLGVGDYVMFPPGEAHQIRNDGAEDLVFIVIADQPQADILHYPDSGKWLLKPQKKVFEMQEVDYFEGEE